MRRTTSRPRLSRAVVLTAAALAITLTAACADQIIDGSPARVANRSVAPGPTGSTPSGSTPSSGTPTSVRPTLSSAASAALTHVPAATLNAVGPGLTAIPLRRGAGAPLTGPGGRPRVLFVGAEFCPYCAATRWPIAVALSRFGTLAGLHTIRSSPSDVDPNTASVTFYRAAYRSSLISFAGAEIEGTRTVNGSYETLDRLSASDARLFRSAGSAFPYLDVGGRYRLLGSAFDPAVLTGLSADQIAAMLATPASPVARNIDGAANVITAAICTLTTSRPRAVCSSRGVRAAARTLPR